MRMTDDEYAAYLKRNGMPVPRQGPQVIDQSVTEGEFQAWVLDLANRNGWLAYHTHDSRKSAAGFPDVDTRQGRSHDCRRAQVRGREDHAPRANAVARRALVRAGRPRSTVAAGKDAASIIRQLEGVT